MMKKRLGLTIIEALTVVAIVAVLVAIMVPALTAAKHTTKVSASIQRLRQFYVVLEQYRTDWDGVDGSWEFYSEALPTAEYYHKERFGMTDEFWKSPCGHDKTIFESGFVNAPGEYRYAGALFDPKIMRPGTGNLTDYGDYLQTYRQNTVMFLDVYCNEHGRPLDERLYPKRALAVLLSGQIVNRMRTGNATMLQFYSDPPTN